jgi:hypothetical protein
MRIAATVAATAQQQTTASDSAAIAAGLFIPQMLDRAAVPSLVRP